MPYILGIVLFLILLVVGTILIFKKRFRDRLVEYAEFETQETTLAQPEPFTYAAPDNENLKTLRERYDLDKIAGQGSESEKIINLMIWVHRLSKHAIEPTLPDELNALHLIHLCRTEKKQLNCWMYSIILNEVYLAMGFKSRIIHLIPYTKENKESHFVVHVFSPTLNKWVMMDPDMCGYLQDENGTLLSIPEIRQHLIYKVPLVVNPEVGGVLKKWTYPIYLSKNLFRFNAQPLSDFGQEQVRTGRTYLELLPKGFRDELLGEPTVTARGNTIFYTNDADHFWQIPALT